MMWAVAITSGRTTRIGSSTTTSHNPATRWRIGNIGVLSPATAIIDSNTFTVYNTAAGVNIGTLFVANGRALGTLNVSGGTLSVDGVARIGANNFGGGNGTLILGANAYMSVGNEFTLGYVQNSTYVNDGGTLLMSGGTLVVPLVGQAFSAGVRGNGWIDQSGGRVTVANGTLLLGRTGGQGTYTLSGSGQIETDKLQYGTTGTVHPNPYNTFNMNGGELSVRNINAAGNATGTNTFNYTAGTLTVSNWSLRTTDGSALQDLSLVQSGGTLSPGTGGVIGGGTGIGTTTIARGSYVQGGIGTPAHRYR